MKKTSSLSSTLRALFGIGGKTPKAYKKITPTAAQDMMNTQKVIILDVRNQDEYDAGHIPNSILLPEPNISKLATQVLPNKDAIILVHCLGGGRSALAAQNLASIGYTNIYDFGGINNWKGKVVQ